MPLSRPPLLPRPLTPPFPNLSPGGGINRGSNIDVIFFGCYAQVSQLSRAREVRRQPRHKHDRQDKGDQQAQADNPGFHLLIRVPHRS
ncbi:hypothetical protein MES5069_550116 [Mesorhizobium escarrei]|uniref:Uncharacterized protein n=1 Tax=Mesorhizobium escarrei TaxID=666018 RepID=A0ABN8K9X0_9HYPH|nr:hypothetical protein MES5069_550116 [Mesorhizobium escarrei]